MSAELNLGKLNDLYVNEKKEKKSLNFVSKSSYKKYFTQSLIWDFLKDQRTDVTFAPCIITLQTKKR